MEVIYEENFKKVLLVLTGCAAKDDFDDYSVTENPPADYLSAETEFSEYDGRAPAEFTVK